SRQTGEALIEPWQGLEFHRLSLRLAQFRSGRSRTLRRGTARAIYVIARTRKIVGRLGRYKDFKAVVAKLLRHPAEETAHHTARDLQRRIVQQIQQIVPSVVVIGPGGKFLCPLVGDPAWIAPFMIETNEQRLRACNRPAEIIDDPDLLPRGRVRHRKACK